MKDFEPNDYLTVKLDKDDDIELFAQINHLSLIRGAFFTDYDSRVTVSVYTPSGRLFINIRER